MMDWVNLAGFVAVIGTLLGLIMPTLRSMQQQIGSMQNQITKLDKKVDDRFVFLTNQIIEINRRLPAAPELLVPSHNSWR